MRNMGIIIVGFALLAHVDGILTTPDRPFRTTIPPRPTESSTPSIIGCPEYIVVPCTDCDGIRIPQGGTSGETDTIHFSPAIMDECYVTDIDILINITHTWLGDLIFDLVTPDGDRHNLIHGRCGSNDDIRAILDDDSNEAYFCPVTDFLRIRTPTSALSNLYGMQIGNIGNAQQSSWQIEITDRFSGDTGMIHHFELHINLSSTAPPTMAPTTFSPTAVPSSIPTSAPTSDICENLVCAVECNTCGLTRYFVEQLWSDVQTGEVTLRYERERSPSPKRPSPKSPRRRGRAQRGYVSKSEDFLLNLLRSRRVFGSGSGSGSGSAVPNDDMLAYDDNCIDLQRRLSWIEEEGMDVQVVQGSGSGSGSGRSGSGIRVIDRRYDFNDFTSILSSSYPIGAYFACGWNNITNHCVSNEITTNAEARSEACISTSPTVSPTEVPTTWISTRPIVMQFSPGPFSTFSPEDQERFYDDILDAAADSLGVNRSNIVAVVEDTNSQIISVIITFRNGESVDETSALIFTNTPLAIEVNGTTLLSATVDQSIGNDSDDVLSTEAIIGIAVGGVILLGLVIVVIVKTIGSSAASSSAQPSIPDNGMRTGVENWHYDAAASF